MVKKNLEKLVSLDEKKLIYKKSRYEKPILNKTISTRFLINAGPGNGDTDEWTDVDYTRAADEVTYKTVCSEPQ